MDFSSGITVVNSVSRRTSVVSSVNHNKRVLLKKSLFKCQWIQLRPLFGSKLGKVLFAFANVIARKHTPSPVS